MLTTGSLRAGTTRALHSSQRAAVVAALVVAPLAAVLALPAVPAAAANPACGSTVTTNVTLTSNLNCSGEMGLTIGHKNITINLNGHSILGGSGADGYEGIYSASNSWGGVTIENGTIDDFEYGVDITGARSLTLKNLTVDVDGTGSYDGVSLGNIAGGTLSGLTIQGDVTSDYPKFGVSIVDSAQVAVSNSTVVGAAADDAAFYEEYGSDDSYAHDTASGIYSTFGNEGYGFEEVDSSSVSYTGSTANHDYEGFYLASDDNGTVTVKNNTANYNDDVGIYLLGCYLEIPSGYKGSLISGNTANHNGWGYYSGSSYYSYNVMVTGNTFNGNSEDGVYSYYDWSGTFSGNSASNNGGDGMYFYYSALLTIKGNTTSDNDNGIDINDNASEYQATNGAANTANGNSDYGLIAADAVPDTGAVNIAKNNGGEDCYNWVCQVSATVAT